MSGASQSQRFKVAIIVPADLVAAGVVGEEAEEIIEGEGKNRKT